MGWWHGELRVFWGSFTFEGRPRPLLDSLRFGLLNEEFIAGADLGEGPDGPRAPPSWWNIGKRFIRKWTESGTEKSNSGPPLSRIRLLAPPFWNFWICPSIGFTFVSVVSFPSCYYNCIVGVVRVRTKLIFFLERQLLALMYYGRSPDVGLRPLSIVLGSVHTKKGRGWLHGGHCKDLFRVFIEPSPAYFAERF